MCATAKMRGNSTPPPPPPPKKKNPQTSSKRGTTFLFGINFVII